jgi:futalosine hydrolase
MPAEPEICKMKVLLIAATAMEIAPAVELLVKSDFMPGECKVSVLITGIGQTATTWMLTNALNTTAPGLVIQAGIAGAFSSSMALGSVVYVQKDCFGDLGMEENGQFSTIFTNGFANADEAPFTDGWLINRSPAINGMAIEAVSAVTINKVTDSIVQRQQLVDQFNPAIETMEGAAFHYVCLKTGIPFIQLRAISNYVGERDKSKWQLQEAIDNLNHKLLQLIEALDK